VLGGGVVGTWAFVYFSSFLFQAIKGQTARRALFNFKIITMRTLPPMLFVFRTAGVFSFWQLSATTPLVRNCFALIRQRGKAELI
jgi:hypothetical protein